MNAFQPEQISKSRRSSKSLSRRADRTVVREISLKIFVNSVLSVVAVIALAKLIPYQLKQQAKQQEMNRETKEIESRVGQLRENFNRNFDPTQSRKIMQELSPKVDPNQRRIFFVAPK